VKKKPYKQKCGEFEIRMLKDGRVVMIAPDDQLMDLARTLDPDNALLPPKTEKKKNAQT
jgi:hypothetical protein